MKIHTPNPANPCRPAAALPRLCLPGRKNPVWQGANRRLAALIETGSANGSGSAFTSGGKTLLPVARTPKGRAQPPVDTTEAP